MPKNLKKIRGCRGIGVNKLGRLTGLSASYISALEKGTKDNPSDEVLEKIADALNVSVDRLTGEAVSSIIEDRLEEIGMTMTELADEAKVSPHWLQNIDTFTPGQWGEDNDIAYKWITQVAEVLSLPGSALRAALARQEIPTYDGATESAIESFATPTLETYPIGELVKVPIIGTVTAGPNGLAYEDRQGEEWVDASLVNGGNYFYLRVKGDSMIGDGILPGDLALVRETPEVNYGALAVVLVNNEEGRIKRVYKNSDSLILQSSNSKYPPEIFKNEKMQNVRIIGEVKSTTRKY